MDGIRRTTTASAAEKATCVTSKLPLGEGGDSPVSVTTEIREGEWGLIQTPGGKMQAILFHVLNIPTGSGVFLVHPEFSDEGDALDSRSKKKEIKTTKRLSRRVKKCPQTSKKCERKNSKKNRLIEEVEKSVPVRRSPGAIKRIVKIKDSDSESHQSRSRLKEGSETACRQSWKQMNTNNTKKVEVITISDDEDEADVTEKVQNDDDTNKQAINRPCEMPDTGIEQELHIPSIRIKNLEELQSPTRPEDAEEANDGFKGGMKKTNKDAHGHVPPRKLNILKSCNRKKCTTIASQATKAPPNSLPVQKNRIESVPNNFLSMNYQNPSSPGKDAESEITISTILGLPQLPSKTPVNSEPPPKKHPRKEKHQLRLSPSHVHSGDSFTLPNSALQIQIQTSESLSSVREMSTESLPVTKSSDQAEVPRTTAEATTKAGVPHPENFFDEDPWRVCTDCGVVMKPSRKVSHRGLSCGHATTKKLCEEDLKNLRMCETCHQIIVQAKVRAHKVKNVMCRKGDQNELVHSYEKLIRSHKKSQGIAAERDRFRVVNEFSALHQCAVCAEWLDSLLSLKSHVGKVHYQIANCVTFGPSYMCRRCERDFSDSFELVAHAKLCTALIPIGKYASHSVL